MDKLKFFFENYITFSTRGPSSFQVTSLTDFYPIKFSSDDFYDIEHGLYITTPIEQRLYDLVMNNSNAKSIALCGVAGSGKSTVSKKVVLRIEKQNLKIKNLFIDIRKENSSNTYDNESDLTKENVRKRIISLLKEDFNFFKENDSLAPTKRQLLYYFLLTAEPNVKIAKESQSFLSLDSLVMSTYNLYLRTRTDLQQNITFKNWFFKKVDESELIQIFEKLEELIDIVHFIAFYKFYDEYSHVNIWLDNIDAFSYEMQSELIKIVQVLQQNVLNSTKIIVAVREENVYKIGNYNDNYIDPFLSQVCFDDPSKAQLGTSSSSFETINNPTTGISKDLLSKIVSRKLEYFHQAQVKKIINTELLLSQSKDIFNDSNSKKTLSQNEKNILLIKIQELDSNLNEQKKALISNQDFEKIKIISDSIIKALNEEQVLNLVGNSIRMYLKIHSEFLYYFLQTSTNVYDFDSLIEKTPSHIKTSFFGWILASTSEFGVNIFNVFKELIYKPSKINNNKKDLHCFLHYLVLTKIWNDCIVKQNNPSHLKNPYVENIIESIKTDFGYSEISIKQAFLELYLQQDGRGNYITFRSKKDVAHINDIDNNTTVKITVKGKATLGFLINSYGYLSACLNFDSSNKYFDVDRFIENLNIISEKHIESLKIIKSEVFENKEDWFSSYLKDYGMPLEKEFVRNKDLGWALEGSKIKKCIYLESVFDSLISFFIVQNSTRARLIALSQKFYSELYQITGLEN